MRVFGQWEEAMWPQEENANSTQKGPGIEPSCNKVTVLTTPPQCHPRHFSEKMQFIYQIRNKRPNIFAEHWQCLNSNKWRLPSSFSSQTTDWVQTALLAWVSKWTLVRKRRTKTRGKHIFTKTITNTVWYSKLSHLHRSAVSIPTCLYYMTN